MKLIKWLDQNLEEILMVLLLLLISFIMLAQIIARYVFNNALSWSDELARYLFVWAGFLSVSFCVKKRISIKIDQMQNALPAKYIPWVKMVRHTIVFIFCILMIPYALTYLQQSIRSGAKSSALGIPMYLIQVAPLVCFLLLAIRVAQAWVNEFKASKAYMAETISEGMHAESLEEIKESESAEAITYTLEEELKLTKEALAEAQRALAEARAEIAALKKEDK